MRRLNIRSVVSAGLDGQLKIGITQVALGPPGRPGRCQLRSFPLVCQQLLCRAQVPGSRMLAVGLQQPEVGAVDRAHQAGITQRLFQRRAKALDGLIAFCVGDILAVKNSDGVMYPTSL